MLRFRFKIHNYNLFYFVLVGFAMALPFSQALVSIFSGVMLVVALAEDSLQNKLERLKTRKYLLLIPSIFVLYLLSSIFTFNSGAALYDLNKSLFFLVIPLSFVFGKPISNRQKRSIFYAFVVAVAVSALIAVLKWIISNKISSFGVHSITYISHIRFSFQLLLGFWFMVLLLQYNIRKFSLRHKIVLISLAVYFLAFLIFQQSLTGLMALGTSVVFYAGYSVFYNHKKYRAPLLGLIVVIISAPVVYVVYVVRDFYDIEVVNRENLEWVTSRGNSYNHNFDDKMVENGRYVNLYVCQDEMREEWNKRSRIKYDSIAPNGFPLHATLLRYLTSKGLRKDADGVSALSAKDVENIENGVANVIYQKKKFSLYPRIYQTVWEYYVYTETGNANYQSFSQRIEFAKAAVTIIKKNFWCGVGTGNWQVEFKQAYHENESKLSEELYASSHNQYLNYWVKFGLIGLIYILIAITIPVLKTNRYYDLLFLIFLAFLAVANFSDSNFESHMGSSFFLYFYCLMLVAGDTNYLNLPND